MLTATTCPPTAHVNSPPCWWTATTWNCAKPGASSATAHPAAHSARSSTTGATGCGESRTIRWANSQARRCNGASSTGFLSKAMSRAAGLVLSAIEEFAQELAAVCRRLLRLKAWRDTETIVIGGGFRASRIGELAIGRAAVLLKADGRDITLQPIRHDPDEAGLLGSTQLVPRWMLSGHEAILAVDIGGTTIRTGVVALEWRKHALTEVRMATTKNWRHKDARPGRDAAVDKLIAMLRAQIKRSERKTAQARTLHWHRLSWSDQRGRSDRTRRPESSGQLGKLELQPAASDPRRDTRNRRRSDARSDAQRCGRSGVERSALDAEGKTLGSADDRHRSRQRALHHAAMMARERLP